jgi:hypothetical protein
MPEETRQSDILSPEVYDVMRSLVTAIRIVKIYPPNNPVYSQTVKEAHEMLSRFLETTPEYDIGVQKAFFTYLHNQIGKDTEANKAIAQDLFTKGLRNIIFHKGVTEKEMMTLFQALALQAKEIGMQSGVSSILWEKSISNIDVNEAGLDEVITAKTEIDKEEMARKTAHAGSASSKPKEFSGHTLVLDELTTDSAGFGAAMVALAKRTRGEHESVEDRLLTLYKEAVSKIQKEHPDQIDTLFEALAESVLSLEQPYREALIAGKLYAAFDSENAEKLKTKMEEQVPNGFHEILTGRFLDSWTVRQVAELLKNLTTREVTSSAPPSSSLALSTISLSSDIGEIAKEMVQYSTLETEALHSVSSVGMESDIIEASMRTLISIIPLVKSPNHATPDEKEIALFNGVIRQLEEMLNYLLKKKDYGRVSLITKTFYSTVDPAFRPRMLEALRKTSSKTFITSTIDDLLKYAKDSAEYVSAYSCLSFMEREATEVLLDLLSKETESKSKTVILDLLKDIGKNQIAVLSEHLSDSRWLFVRDIINILSEIKSDQAVVSLQKAVENKNIKVRQEVVKCLISIGGKKAAGLLAKFLKDEDDTIKLMAIRGFMEIKGINTEDTKALTTFLYDRPLRQKDQALTLEAIKALGKVGSPAANDLLNGYTRVRWWKSRKPQIERRDAALKAMAEIKRRQGNGGSAKR